MKAFFKKSLGLLMLASSAMAAPPAATAAETLSLAHFVAPAHIITELMLEPLAEGVEADSGGELTIEIYPGGQLGAGPLEQYVRAVQGVADITWGLAGYTSSQFPKTMVVEIPGAKPEDMPGYEMLWNAYDEHLADEFPGTRPLALWTSEPSVFIMKDHEIRSPSDLEGLRVRVSGSVPGALLEALGATPVQMPANEMYNALQTGLIDGIVTGASAITDFKLDEVANSYSVGAPLGHIVFYLVMNQARYDGLNEEQRAALDKHTGLVLSQIGEEGWNAAAESTLERLREDPDHTVIELSEEEIAAFKAIADPLREKLLAELEAQDVLDAMLGN